MRHGSRSKPTIAVVMGFALLAAACSNGLVKSLSNLNAISNHLKQKYHDEVAVNLYNSRFLRVMFVNSSLNKMSPAAREERAQDAARFISRNYEDIKSIETILVAFAASETHFVFYHRTEVLGTFGFDRNGTPLAKDGDPSELDEDPRKPVARFNAVRNETDISLLRIQLQGDMTNGVALVPHFVVIGNAQQTRGLPPEAVTLDFASYSPQPLFTSSPDLAIYCDGRLAVKGRAQLLPSNAAGTEDTIAQFLSVRVSFKSFQKMAQAEKVQISLGPQRFELAPDDIRALAGMAAYVQTPSEP